jgi:hypothetical protein
MRPLALILTFSPVLLCAADYGAPLPANPAAQPLAEALAAGATAGASVVVEGRIAKVCQNKGCWLMLSDGDIEVRVMTKHKFFVPTDAQGSATVVGTLVRYEFDAEEAAHMSKDAAGKGRHLAAGATEWRIEASSIRIEAEQG